MYLPRTRISSIMCSSQLITFELATFWYTSNLSQTCPLIYFSKPTRSQPPSTCLHSLYSSIKVHLQSWLITCSKYLSKFTSLPPPSISPKSLNHDLQVHFYVFCFTVSKCNSMLSQVQPSVSHNYCFQVHANALSRSSSNRTAVQSAPSLVICLLIDKLW